MDSKKKIKLLLESKWSNHYFCKLALLDHLRECLEKDNLLKATDTPKSSVGYENLEKELMDLGIILNIYFDGNDELLDKRLNKFIENLNK
ncbi:MAG: hypothetical protein NTW50_03350 [Candidatus Berkelbacteria bacterium]|nr:hypothetical protein [Candidatus Berkelbacteria bacterium]